MAVEVVFNYSHITERDKMMEFVRRNLLKCIFQVVQAHPQEAPRMDGLHSPGCNLCPPRQIFEEKKIAKSLKTIWQFPICTVEHVVSNLLPVALGPLIVGSHPATMWLWFRFLWKCQTSFVISHEFPQHCSSLHTQLTLWLPSTFLPVPRGEICHSIILPVLYHKKLKVILP